jgi:selenocysteine lyase/cysteine desulfurase
MDWGISEISDTAGSINRQLAAEASDLGFSSPSEKLRAPHYLCLRRKAGIPADLSQALAREKIFLSVRGSSLRVAPHVYNSQQDADRLITCLRKIMAE